MQRNVPSSTAVPALNTAGRTDHTVSKQRQAGNTARSTLRQIGPGRCSESMCLA